MDFSSSKMFFVILKIIIKIYLPVNLKYDDWANN